MKHSNLDTLEFVLRLKSISVRNRLRNIWNTKSDTPVENYKRIQIRYLGGNIPIFN